MKKEGITLECKKRRITLVLRRFKKGQYSFLSSVRKNDGKVFG